MILISPKHRDGSKAPNHGAGPLGPLSPEFASIVDKGAQVFIAEDPEVLWHTHPLWQTLIIVSGRGRVQAEGKPVFDMNPADVIWIPAGVKHWHGVAPDSAMSLVAIGEALDGKSVDWMEQVSDAIREVAPRRCPWRVR